MVLSAAHFSYLTGEGVDPGFLKSLAESGAVRTDNRDGRDGIVFVWNPGNGGKPSEQFRADVPGTYPDGAEYPKYKAGKGPFPLWLVREGAEGGPVLLVEGTKQSLVAASYAPASASVFAIAGCGNWNVRSLQALKASGRQVTVILDADMATNVQVFAMAEQLRENLAAYPGTKVTFARIPHKSNADKDGLDDYLKAFPEGDRAEMLGGLLESASEKLPRRPKAKAPKLDDDDAAVMDLFQKVGNSVRLKSVDAARKVLDGMPAAVTAEKKIAVYQDGVYRIEDDAILGATVGLLGNMYTPGLRSTITETLRGLLTIEGRILPDHTDQPLMNTPSGMVDLRTGEQKPHGPEYFSYVQTAVAYDPSMPTPVYDAWIRDALRQPGHTDADIERLLADLEEVAGTMLDPSRAPEKILFLFGPTRSGKSLFLGLLESVAGLGNISAETLHDLASDQFAKANLYGKMLNVSADLSNKHVEDLSVFKMITGRDTVKANRKYGTQFTFKNQALLAFSANELPTVSESSRAYAARVKPFHFPTSHEGREDLTLKGRLEAELPGILARWVKAYGRFLARGGYAETDAATRTEFEAKSDRVVQFFQDMCTLTEARHGDRLEEHQATGRRDASRAFNEWAERNGGSKMGEKAFFQRFSNIAGVAEVRIGRNSRVAYNVVVARADDDSWKEEAEPQPDPITPSGVALDEPQNAPESDGIPRLSPTATETVNGAQAGSDGFELTASADASDPWAGDPFTDF